MIGFFPGDATTTHHMTVLGTAPYNSICIPRIVQGLKPGSLKEHLPKRFTGLDAELEEADHFSSEGLYSSEQGPLGTWTGREEMRVALATGFHQLCVVLIRRLCCFYSRHLYRVMCMPIDGKRYPRVPFFQSYPGYWCRRVPFFQNYPGYRVYRFLKYSTLKEASGGFVLPTSRQYSTA